MKEKIMYSVEIDISHEASHLEVNNFAIEHGCHASLITLDGPAGGNPLYKFTSKSFDMLLELVQQYFGPSSGFTDQELEAMIKEV